MYVTQTLTRPMCNNRDGVATEFRGRRRTWSEFGARVARLAGSLRALGVTTGDRVGMLSLNSDRYLEYFYAVVWAGGVFVPINTRLAPPEIVYWVNDSGCSILFVEDTFLPVVAEIRNELPTVNTFVYCGDGEGEPGLLHCEALVEQGSAIEDAGRGGNDLAGIYYTGGTTGKSKGVMLSHANIICNALNVLLFIGFDATTTWLHAAPMFHLADGSQTFATSMVGGRHAFIPRFEPIAFLTAVQDHAVTNSLVVPTMINMLANSPELARFDLSTLKAIQFGGAPMSEAVVRAAMKRMPHVGFTQGYGQTESGPAFTQMPRMYGGREDPVPGKMTSVGCSVTSTEVRVVDETDREVPRGIVGEIVGRGGNVMLGYWNQPELTAQALRGGWLHTGDAGYMDADGYLYVVDRLKDMIITGGENVYPAEVEHAIFKHPSVQECAVIAVPDDTWGESVHAVIRLKPATELDSAELIAHCKRLIANYKCPRTVEFRDTPLPLSGAGKVQKSELRKKHWAGLQKAVG